MPASLAHLCNHQRCPNFKHQSSQNQEIYDLPWFNLNRRRQASGIISLVIKARSAVSDDTDEVALKYFTPRRGPNVQHDLPLRGLETIEFDPLVDIVNLLGSKKSFGYRCKTNMIDGPPS